MLHTLSRSLVVLALLGVLAPPLAAARTPAQRCAIAKLVATKRYIASTFDCQALAALGGTPVDPTCIAEAAARLDTVFARAENRPGCATTGDAATIRSVVDHYVGTILANVRPPTDPGGTCTAARLRAARDAASDGLDCYIGFARRAEFFDFDCTLAANTELHALFAAIDAPGTCIPAINDFSGVYIEWGFLVGTGQRLPFTLCGNGRVELGEGCEAGPQCDASCQITFPSCCATFGSCMGPEGCVPEIGQVVPGTMCMAGTCQTVPLAEPVAVCCQATSTTCSETTVSDTAALAAAVASCPLDPTGGVGNQKLDHTCRRGRRCRPVRH